MWLRWFPWKLVVRRLARTHGFVDPIAILSHLRRFAQPSEVAVPIELLRAGVVFHARGLINSRVIQQNLDWVWPYWIRRQFDPETPSFIPRAFSLTHVNLTARNWTAVGVPGHEPLPIVDPRGLVTPFWDGWSLDAWIVREDRDALIPSHAADARQELDLSGDPAVVTTSKSMGMELQSRAEMTAGADLQCRIQWRASAGQRAWLVVGVRPYNPEGVSFIHRIRLDRAPARWTINRKHAVRFAERPDHHAVSEYMSGDVVHRLFGSGEGDAIACDVGMATAAAMFELKPGHTREVSVHVPVETDKKRHAHPHAPCIRPSSWEEELSGVCRIQVPDERMQFLYDAALRTLVLHCPSDVYPGPFTYKRFWFRDAAFILHAMLCAGMHRRVEAAIQRFFPRQTAGGYFRSQEGEWDANGEVLWLLQRFCELTGREPPEEWERPVLRAAHWIMRKRLADRTDVPCAGLMPAGFSAEHLGPNDYYFWDDFWSIAGLHSAAWLCSRFGRQKESTRFRDEAKEFAAAVERSLARIRARTGSAAMPASCYRRMDSGAIGSIVAGYPLDVLSPRDERLLATVEYLLEHCTVDGGFFQDMIHSGINAYLTLHMAQVLLRAGDARFADPLRAVSRLASPTGQWPEAIHPRTGGGCMGDGQHAWAAAEWVMMMRNCLVYEDTRAGRLVVGAGIIPEWPARGEGISIGPTPTPWGPISLSFEPSGATIHVRWQADWRDVAPPIDVRLSGSEPVTVEASQGRVTLNRSSE